MSARIVVTLLMLAFMGGRAEASGHGPVFGAATPTLGKGGWSFDQAWMGRIGTGTDDSDQMLRSMISFGLTEDRADFRLVADQPPGRRTHADWAG